MTGLLEGALADGHLNSFGQPPRRARAHLRLMSLAGHVDSLRHPLPGSSVERAGTLVEIADARTSVDDARIALSLELDDDGGWEIDRNGMRWTLVPRDRAGRRVR